MNRSQPIVTALLAVLAMASAGAACDRETPLGPEPSSIGGAPVIEVFTGTLTVSGAAFYSFTVPREGTVSLTLLSVREAGVDSTTPLGLALGIPAGVGCTTGVPANAIAGAVPQVSLILSAGVYCGRISDLGQLTAPATFAINITRPR